MELFASDLDNTLLFSHRHACRGRVCVEYLDGLEQGFMHPEAMQRLRLLAQRVCFVPVTTRIVEQYERIRLPCPRPRYALVSNGAILLADGIPDASWTEESRRLAAPGMEEMGRGFRLLQSRPETPRPRMADGFFCYAKSSDPEQTRTALGQELDPRLVTISRAGSKIYILPAALTKGNALLRLQERLHPHRTAAAGDGEMDFSMLSAADAAILPSAMLEAYRQRTGAGNALPLAGGIPEYTRQVPKYAWEALLGTEAEPDPA